mgnify:CR=1 FL=1
MSLKLRRLYQFSFLALSTLAMAAPANARVIECVRKGQLPPTTCENPLFLARGYYDCFHYAVENRPIESTEAPVYDAAYYCGDRSWPYSDDHPPYVREACSTMRLSRPVSGGVTQCASTPSVANNGCQAGGTSFTAKVRG